MLDEINDTEEVVKEAPLEQENQIEKPDEAAPEITPPVVEEVAVIVDAAIETVSIEALVSAESVPETTAAATASVVEPIADIMNEINTEIKAVDEILSKKRSFEKIASTTEAVDMRKESESKRLKIDQPVSH